MRGSPLISVLLLAIALLLAGIPVWSLTRPHEHVGEVSPAPTAATTKRPVEMAVTATAGAAVELRQGDKVVWQSATPGETFAQNFPDLAPDLVAHVRWVEAGKHNAVRLVFSRDGELLADVTLWGEQEAEGVIALKAP